MTTRETASRGPVEILAFEVAARRFGIRTANVREVLRASTLLDVPDALGRLDGVLNLRGQVVPVVNLRAWFELPVKAVEHTDLFIVCEAGGRILAVRADGKVELVLVANHDFEPPPEGMPTLGIVAGVAKTPGGLVLVVEPERLLSTADPAAAGGETAS